ncbi:MAG: threonine synthase [Clostridia bacterium]|nr:threonine synthase [Clostridia bacterium]
MKYISTRGGSPAISSAEAIRNGLAPDGGLYMPDCIPSLSEDDLKCLCGMGYSERAACIMHRFLYDSFPASELLSDCRSAYSGQSFPGEPARVVPVGNSLRVLELWHGPTAAFKDMALQIMPHLFVSALRKTGDNRRALILVATSGDTGKAALEGYRDVDGVDIAVFYPVNGVSTVQKLQMATQTGKNVYVRAVEGNFDDAQTGVKKIFSDPAMGSKLNEKGYFLSSANSINWGRLVPQICYYISAYCDLISTGDINAGETVDIAVPTGNFGNILAAFIAKKMGLPVGKLLCASNVNNVLTDFFNTGKYDRNRDFRLTVSPSMDILISSNLERLLYLVCGTQKTAIYMEKLKKEGKYAVDNEDLDAMRADFDADYCDEEGTLEEIRHMYTDFGYLCDTHTAVALKCAERHITPSGRKIIVASTANAYKFSPAVLQAISGEKCEGINAIGRLHEITGVEIPSPLRGIAERQIRFDPHDSILPSEMPFDVMQEIIDRNGRE